MTDLTFAKPPPNQRLGIVHDMPDAEYHQRPELSSTGARLILPEYKGSPRKFKWAETHRRTSRAFDVGHAVHAKVLGVGAGVVAYPPEHLTPSGNVSTKAATVAWEQEQRAAGLVPIGPWDARHVNAMAEAVLSHPTARPIFEVASHREVSVFAEVDGVPVRARFDALSDETRDGVYAADLKTTDDATKTGFEKSVAKWGYDVQEAHYEDTYRASEDRPIDKFFFIAVEKSGPYEVGVHRLPDIWLEMGKAKAVEARRIYRECVETGVWPGYDTTIQFLDPPTWLVFEHEARYENQEIQI
jgi:exodeoxyribonuclease VIII